MNILRRFIKFLLITIIILAVAIIAAINIIDFNNYKENISNIVFKQTGRNLIIDGNIKLSFTPNLTIAINNVSLENKSDFPGPFVNIDRIMAKLSLQKLLVGNVSIIGVELDSPRIHLKTLKSGKTNFNDLLAKPTAKLENNSKSTSTKNSSLNLVPIININKFKISNVNLIWEDLSSDIHLEIKKTNILVNNFKLDNLSLVGPINISTTITDLTKKLPEFNVTAIANINLRTKQVKLDSLTLKQNDSLLNSNLIIEAGKEQPTIEGSFTLDNLEPTILLELMNKPLTNAKHLPKKINGKWSLSYAEQQVSIKDFSLNIAEGAINGEMQLNLLSAASSSIQIDSSFDGKELEMIQLLSFIGQPEKLSGKTNFNLILQTKGEETEQFKQNLGSVLELSLGNGKLYGIDMHKLLKHVERTINELYAKLKESKRAAIQSLFSSDLIDLESFQTDSSVTKFESFKLSSVFKNGLSKNTNFVINNYDYNIQGNGAVDLPKNKLNLLVKASYKDIDKDNSSEITEYILKTPLTITVKGDIDKPKITPNTDSYMETALQGLQKTLLKDFTTDALKKMIPYNIGDIVDTPTEGDDSPSETAPLENFGEKLFESIFSR